MLCQVIVCSVSNTPQFPPAKREQELHVCGSLAVEAQLFLIVVAITYLILFKTQRTEPVKAELLPVCKPFKVCIRLTEKFQLHLLKLTGTEGKVSRSDLITERFTDLSDSKWNFLSGGSLYILKVYENTLRGFRTKVYGIFCILSYTLEGLEHQVKLTDVCKVMFAAAWAGNLMLFDKFHHLFLRPGIYASFNLDPMLCTVVLDQLICTETLMALLTVHQRIRKSAQVTRSYPCLRIHKNRTVYAYIVGRLLNKFLPPRSFYVVFQLHTQVSIVPGICQTTVNLRARIDESSGFCQSNNFFHCFFHNYSPKFFNVLNCLVSPAVINALIILASFCFFNRFPPIFLPDNPLQRSHCDKSVPEERSSHEPALYLQESRLNAILLYEEAP